MPTPSEFAVFVLSSARANNVRTIDTIRRQGYTGPAYVVVDDEEPELAAYQAKFGESLIVFSRKDESAKSDQANNLNGIRSVVVARNACFGIAKMIGVTNFLELDDDYSVFAYELASAHKRTRPIRNLDSMFQMMVEFHNSCDAMAISFAQSGDFIGGLDNGRAAYRFSKRKCMQSFFCSVNRQFDFVGWLNDDVNTYVVHGSRGKLFLTIPVVSVSQAQTQSRRGGLTEVYRSQGTYAKSFVSVMMSPSSVKVKMMESRHKRIHHAIDWPRAVPCIIQERYRKV